MSKLSRTSLALVSILLVFQTIGCKRGEGVENKPNFLFILVDDLGKEWISAYGADSVHTPFIDELASTGITFQNVYSMRQCTPSRVTLLTGQYPYNHGWINHYDVPRWGHGARFDPEKNTTFANILLDNGYRTCAAASREKLAFRVGVRANTYFNRAAMLPVKRCFTNARAVANECC